jgi:hypothetical protein
MKNVKFTFEGSEITFTFDTENKIMVNATEMAKVFNARINDFIRLDNTKSFIKECLSCGISRNSDEENNGNSRYLNIESEEDLYTTNHRLGTFMHQVLALKFAAWISPKFELWVYCTIQHLLFGRLIEREESLKTTTILKNEKKSILDKEVYTGEDFERYLKIHDELRMEENKRRNLTKDCINEIQINIDFHEN